MKWFVALIALVFAGCARPVTQLVVEVRSDAPVGSYECVGLSVAAEGRDATEGFVAADQASLPFSFGVVSPDGDASGAVTIAVSLLPSCDPPTGPVPRVAVRARFVEGRAVTYSLRVEDTCGIGCEEGESCGASGCAAVSEVTPDDIGSGGAGAPNGGSLNLVFVP